MATFGQFFKLYFEYCNNYQNAGKLFSTLKKVLQLIKLGKFQIQRTFVIHREENTLRYFIGELPD